MNLRLVKAVDAKIGRLAASILPPPSHARAEGIPSSILLIRPGGIGDAVLLAPAIAAMKQKTPTAKIAALAERRNAGAFSMIPGITRVLRYDVPRELVATFRLRPDLVIDTEQYHRLSAVVARLLGATTLIGFNTNERARLFHHAVPYCHDENEAISFFRLLAPLGIAPPVSITAPFLSVPPADRALAAQLLAPFADQPFVTVFPGASIPERRWGWKQFAATAAKLNARGYPVVILGGKNDQDDSQCIVAEQVLDLAGKTTLSQSAAVIDRSSLLISGDSGLLHIGVGLGTPTVSLFGPGIAAKWAPRGPQHIVINKNLSCSPCTRFGSTPSCSRRAECLTRIGVDEVVTAALRLLPKP